MLLPVTVPSRKRSGPARSGPKRMLTVGTSRTVCQWSTQPSRSTREICGWVYGASRKSRLLAQLSSSSSRPSSRSESTGRPVARACSKAADRSVNQNSRASAQSFMPQTASSRSLHREGFAASVSSLSIDSSSAGTAAGPEWRNVATASATCSPSASSTWRARQPTPPAQAGSVPMTASIAAIPATHSIRSARFPVVLLVVLMANLLSPSA